MKINKVQISGFRAFSKVEDSTFNFMLPNNKIANFVSIYAPNGFGKTSFYDAVEWGITHQIQRFDRMVDFNKIRKENSGPVLLNNVSAKGEVLIQTTTGEFKNEIKNRRVYNPKGIPENPYFKEVILSQDLIDTFIKEEKAEDRYNKFVDFNPQIKIYNTALKNLSKLLDFVEDCTKDLNTSLGEKRQTQLTIDFEEEGKKFDEINKSLRYLKEKKEELDLIEKDTFTQKKYDLLEQKIKSRLISLSIEIETVKLKIENIDIAYNGLPDSQDDTTKGIFNYFDNRTKSKEIEKIKDSLRDIVNTIKNKEDYELKDKDFKTKISDELEVNKLYLSFKEKFKTYITVENEVFARNKIISNYEAEKTKSENLIKELNELNQKNTTDLNRLQNELVLKQTKLKNIPSQKEKQNNLNTKVQSLATKINDLAQTILEKERVIEGLTLKLNQNQFFTDKVDSDIEILLDFDEFKNSKELINVILELENKININREEISKVNDKINLQNELNTELKDFVSKGLDIVSKSGSVDCPLCTQHYDSYLQLSERITANKLLGKIVQESLEIKLKLENEISNYSTDISKNKTVLKDDLKTKIQPFIIDNQKNKTQLDNLVATKEESIQEQIKSENELKEINKFFEDSNNVETFEENIKKEIKVIENEISNINKITQKNIVTINDQYNLIRSSEANKVVVSKSISELKSVKEYYEVIKFYSDILKTNEINITLLNEQIQNSDKYLEELKKENDENLKALDNVNSKLLTNTLSKDEVLKKLKEIEMSISLINKILQNFEQYMKTEFKIDIASINKEQVDSEFEKLKNTEKEKLQILSSINENYLIVDKLKEDCLKVTEAEKLEKEINEILKELKIIGSIKVKLKSEKDNLIQYLKKTINGFFYKELINKIYSKIDPHPDYNEIEFECDFEERNPRLQIYTIKYINQKPVKSVPALYFSTAQINILSLSIFLARALKARNPESTELVDCIFIDDPIQSMDSINVLSFIDLFRSMVLFLNKQVIVSTHEENFHLLLQKKIPVKLFDSKFIEFETFGKLLSI